MIRNLSLRYGRHTTPRTPRDTAIKSKMTPPITTAADFHWHKDKQAERAFRWVLILLLELSRSFLLWEDEHAGLTAGVTTNIPTVYVQLPTDLVLDFDAFPYEIRGTIFDIYYAQHFAPIKINEFAEFVAPPLTSASKPFVNETWIYYTRWCGRAITDTSVEIHAQIRDFDYTRLIRRLQALGEHFKIPVQDLIARTKVEFLGRWELENAMSWIDHMPMHTPQMV